MTTREAAEQILARLEGELGQDAGSTPISDGDQGWDEMPEEEPGPLLAQGPDNGVVVGAGLTQDHGEWRVIVYLRDGSELPTRLRAFLSAQRDDIELVESGPFELE